MSLKPEDLAIAIMKRREAGYPLHSPPHPFRQSGEYLITATTYRHDPILADLERCSDFEIMLLAACRDIDANAIGWVILPDHYHLLVDLVSLDLVSVMLKHLHGRTAREWNLADGLTSQRKVWYKFYDRMIRDEDHRFRSLNYFHYNPVKHRLVGNAYDWSWSSLHGYLEVEGREWLKGKWSEHPPGEMGQGWDNDPRCGGQAKVVTTKDRSCFAID